VSSESVSVSLNAVLKDHFRYKFGSGNEGDFVYLLLIGVSPS